MTNAEIRYWYQQKVAQIRTANERWIAEGIPVKQRALRAWEMRRKARQHARELMQNPLERESLQERDRARYANPQGPTFEWLVQKARQKGLVEPGIYEYLIERATSTDPLVDKLLEGKV